MSGEKGILYLILGFDKERTNGRDFKIDFIWYCTGNYGVASYQQYWTHDIIK